MDSKVLTRFFEKYNANFTDSSQIMKNRKKTEKKSENSIQSVAIAGILYFLQSNQLISKQIIEEYLLNKENSIKPNDFVTQIINYVQFIPSKVENSSKKIMELWSSEILNIDEQTSQENYITPAILGHLYEASLYQKPTGSFYTPKRISHQITQETINHYCCERINQRFKIKYKDLEQELLEQPNITPVHIEHINYLYSEILLNLKLCDNSCGAGEFLLSAFEFLLQLRMKCQTILTEKKKISIQLEALNIITKNIYGMDLQSDAIFITRIRLWLAYLAKCTESHTIETNNENDYPLMNLASGNSLLLDWTTQWKEVFKSNTTSGFEIIVGNPPYGQNTISEQMRKDLKQAWNPASLGKKSDGKTYNLSAVFVEQSYHLLCQNGCLGLILNNSIARVEEFTELRKFILSQGIIWKIVDEGNPFSDSNVTLEMIDLFWQKSGKSQDKREDEYYFSMLSHRKQPAELIEIPISLWQQWNRWILYPDEIFTWIYNHAQIGCLSGTRGRDLPKIKEKSRENSIPYLFSGKSVKKYRLDPSQFQYIPISTLEKPTWKSEIENASILITTKITDRYRVMLKPIGMAIGNNVIKLQLKKIRLDQFVIMALLNSHLMDFVVRKYIINESELTTAFYDSITQFTPIQIPNEPLPFQILAQCLIFLATQSQKTRYEEIERWLNALVYETYFREKISQISNKTSLDQLFLTTIQPISFDKWFFAYWKQINPNFSEQDHLLQQKHETIIMQEIETIYSIIKADTQIAQKMEEIFQYPEIQIIEAYVRAR